jgi:polyhydroxybutyrate depolymerase
VGTVVSAGLDREYVLHIPGSYEAGSPMPLMVVFHGYAMTAAAQESESGLPSFGEEEGFITVFPEGRGDEQRWLLELDSAELDITTSNPDIEFVDDLLDKLSAELSVDTDRIYAVGFSNGGWMASAVACTLPDRIAAAAPVAGVMDVGSDCARNSPVPMVTFHGTSDQYEPFDGGIDNAPFRASLPTDVGGTFGELPLSSNTILEVSVPEKVRLWAQANGCESDPSLIEQEGESVQWDFVCPDNAHVVLYEVTGGTHWWGVAAGFDTNAMLWDFLSNSTE